MLPETLAMEHLLLNDTTNFQHQIDLLRQEMEKNITANINYKNFINKKLADERAIKNGSAEILYERLRMLEEENYLKY